MYIRALEEHIAELEQLLAESGHDSVTVDHWKEKRQQLRRDSYMHDGPRSSESHDSLPATTDDPVWNAIMNSGTDDSTLSTGRLFKSVIANDMGRTMGTRGPPSPSRLTDLSSPEVAGKLLNGYIKHLSTQYPVLHTPRLKTLHARPVESLNVFEQCVLHLVYANSGRILEAVSLQALVLGQR